MIWHTDFIHKMGICEKELRESQCWLELITCADLWPESRLSPLLDESDEVIAIIVKSIATAKTGRQISSIVLEKISVSHAGCRRLTS